MKIRIKSKENGFLYDWHVQEKKWWGWRTIYKSKYTILIDKFLKELKEYRDVKLLRQ